MILPVFSLTIEIDKYNKVAVSHVSLDESFNFPYFEHHNLSFVDDLIKSLNSPITDDFYRSEEKLYLALLKESETSRAIVISSKNSLSKSIQQKQAYLNWLQDYRHYFNTLNWQQWLAATQNSYLSQLQAVWESQQVFAHYTHAALLKAIHQLAELKQHLLNAAQALATFPPLKIPNAILLAYSQYIQQSINQINEYEKQVAAAMMTRLTAWEAGHTNVLSYFKSELVAAGVKPVQLAMPIYHDAITPDIFQGFQQAIFNADDVVLKQRFNNLFCYCREKLLPTQAIKINHHQSLIVPTEFAKEIPAKRRKPRWLFKGYNFRHDFFKDRTYLIEQFNKSPQIDQIVIAIETPDSYLMPLKLIRKQETLIQTELKRLSLKRQNLSKRFQGKALQMLNNWQQKLTQHQTQQTYNKLQLAEGILDQLLHTRVDKKLGQAVNPITNNAYWYGSLQAAHLLKEISEDLTRYPTTSALKTKLEMLQQQAASLFVQSDAYAALKQLANNQAISCGELQSLFHYLDVYLLTPQERHSFIALTQSFLDQIAQHLQATLKTFAFGPHPAKTLQTQVNKIMCFYAVVAELGTEPQKAKATHQLQKYFLRYCQALMDHLQLPASVPSRNLVEGEIILKHFGSGIHYAGKSLAQHIEDLQSLKLKLSSQKPHEVSTARTLLECKCKALIQPLAASLITERVEKDTKQLDNNLQTWLLSRHSLDHLQVEKIFEIRDRALHEHQSLDTLSLERYEKELIGIGKSSKAAVIKSLLEASIQAHEAQAKIKESPYGLDDKLNCLATLNQQLQQKVPATHYVTLLQAGRHKRLLFSNTYSSQVPAQLPTQAAKSIPASTLTP